MTEFFAEAAWELNKEFDRAIFEWKDFKRVFREHIEIYGYLGLVSQLPALIDSLNEEEKVE